MRPEGYQNAECQRERSTPHLVVVSDGVYAAMQSVHLDADDANHCESNKESECVGRRPCSFLLRVHKGRHKQRRKPEHPRPALCREGFDVLRALATHPRLGLPFTAATTCPLPRSTARGDALLAVASFGMVAWVMVRGVIR
jgi:hypothetical protein